MFIANVERIDIFSIGEEIIGVYVNKYVISVNILFSGVCGQSRPDGRETNGPHSGLWILCWTWDLHG